MTIKIFTDGPVSDELRDKLSTLALGIHELHRTGPWMHVSHYDIINEGSVHHIYSYNDRPLYAAHCIRGGRLRWIVLSPNHPKKDHRWFFAEREGGEL